MPDAKSRAKVQRLLRGDFREGDLKDLFRFARDHCDGRRTIKDIGDFVAHHNERDRGLITASIRDWFTVVRFHIPIIHRKSALDAKNMPPAFRDYMKIAVNRIDAKIVSERTKLRKADAYKMSLDVAGRLKG